MDAVPEGLLFTLQYDYDTLRLRIAEAALPGVVDTLVEQCSASEAWPLSPPVCRAARDLKNEYQR